MSIDNNDNISIIRISSVLKGFELADKLNKFFNFELKKTSDFTYEKNGTFISFDCFSYHNPFHSITILLINNNGNDEFTTLVASSIKKINYLFVVIGRDHEHISHSFIKGLTKVEINRKKTKINEKLLTYITNIPQINALQTDFIYPSKNKTTYISEKLKMFLLNYPVNVLNIYK
ncbi:MAG: hypothetical protein LBR28_04670 [Bacteroidales bacterium]|jgi:hypothetical protein|nr:hypothetical protein [Bacteroidales bacterium]